MINMSKRLKGHIGRKVEVFFMNEFIQGVLVDVQKGFFTLKVDDLSYCSSCKLINILNQNVEYMQFLKA